MGVQEHGSEDTGCPEALEILCEAGIHVSYDMARLDVCTRLLLSFPPSIQLIRPLFLRLLVSESAESAARSKGECESNE